MFFKLENIQKIFGGIIAIENVSLEIEKEEIMGLIGPNGAGKTTALNIMSGLIYANKGRQVFNKVDVTNYSPEKRSQLGMARTFQNSRLFEEMTVKQNVMAGAHSLLGRGFWRTITGISQHREIEERITDVAEKILIQTSLDKNTNKLASQLSYGEKKRVEIARALASKPSLLMLDEPAAGLNEYEKDNLVDLLQKLNQENKLTIVLIEHNVAMVKKLCHKTCVFDKGTILAQGNTSEVLQKKNVIDVYIGNA